MREITIEELRQLAAEAGNTEIIRVTFLPAEKDNRDGDASGRREGPKASETDFLRGGGADDF